MPRIDPSKIKVGWLPGMKAIITQDYSFKGQIGLLLHKTSENVWMVRVYPYNGGIYNQPKNFPIFEEYLKHV